MPEQDDRVHLIILENLLHMLLFWGTVDRISFVGAFFEPVVERLADAC
ncbi:MAG: hypothetical protein ABT940_02785 [Alphaproteobacteria bacterium]